MTAETLLFETLHLKNAYSLHNIGALSFFPLDELHICLCIG